ncbi:Rv0361 family membrane protein [Micromonospora sp. NBC_01813]|uniref:Rv0361 family membrane protein n=1 Tax=Micromonospora sp. NBC_01813 TaxID=2975988 RepID=UPI002DD90607|nr:hypothetical protein [Micromonospora sp. NBC_01813]WSA06753.1 hypothetical protein OG958_21005 [Micromonospora sp. NBC_01813]
MEQTRPATPVRRGWVPRQRTAPGVMPPPVVPPGRRLRLALVLAAGITALLCLGGAGVAFVLYANVTTPDRGTPESAVRGYLVAYLYHRDDVQAATYVCAQPDLSEIEQLRSSVVAYEERANVLGVVQVLGVTVQTESAGEAVVVATIHRTLPSGSTNYRFTDEWRFTAVDEGGWRVCGAEKLE